MKMKMLITKTLDQLKNEGAYSDETNRLYESYEAYENDIGQTKGVMVERELGIVYKNVRLYETTSTSITYQYVGNSATEEGVNICGWAVDRFLDPEKDSMYFV